MSKLQEKMELWKQPPEGFFLWLEAVKPKIKGRQGKFEIFEPTKGQIDFFQNALAVDDQGNFKHKTIVNCQPRRHGKTVLSGLLVLWRFTLFDGEMIYTLANSQSQSRSVQYKTLMQILLNNPFLTKLIGRENIKYHAIEYPNKQSYIVPVTASAPSLYGQKLSVAWITELHSADPECSQILASSLGDTENSWFLIDSSTDAEGGPIHQLEQAQDDSAYCFRIEYNNLADALENSPHWIDRKWLKSREKQLLPATFASQHLNKRSEASNTLFNINNLKACKLKYNIRPEIEELETLVSKKKYICGGGLDRAFFFSKHGDNTIWTVALKTASEQGEPVFYMLNQEQITAGLARSIKKTILQDQVLGP